ncbi:MAG TPA: S8 family serine peptidase [Thermoanaerobaculia bacterium]|nr:S8 family serine peptidase [Thermoanaerobaculia bacterium]
MSRTASLLLCALVLGVAAAPVTAQDEAGPVVKARAASNSFIVRMSEDPVVAYRGGIAGLKATKPAKGQKINPNSPDVVRYVAYLQSRHDAALAAVGGGRKLYDYKYVLNGFAAKLTPEQAAEMKNVPGVVSVENDERLKIDTVSTPAFLGLTAPGGLWEQLGGSDSAGENIIIGVVDTGVWPEHPSFSDRTGENNSGVGDKLSYKQIPGWHGKCTPGEAFSASNCNQKLIGCQGFSEAFGPENFHADEFASCRDSDSHGTHTATTAGGNHGVPSVIDGISIGPVSGMAPRARIAAYKVCWTDTALDNSCFTSDSAAAIDQAVADGVDVLNFSISGTTTNFLNAVEVAFLFASDAGVFVAAAAGNTGPTAGTVNHPSPWLTTVAASTHDRFFQGSAVLGNGAEYTGASLTGGTGPGLLPLVYAGSVGVSTDPTPTDPTPFATRVQLCFLGHLDPALAAGKIVLCDRGINARVDKSAAVKQANGAGMILRNLVAGTLNADVHSVPSVHVEHTVAGPAIKAYIDASPATASARITDGAILTTVAAPLNASFSSRGPLAATGDLLKPDVSAPGVDVLAGTSPWGNLGQLFGFLQGTSMASPHVAGLGALLKQLHPDWTPMMIKSALMTSASQIPGVNAFAQGAGHATPNKAADAGLVYNAGFNEWLAFLCGTGQLVDPGCAAIAIDPSDLNVASIAIGDLLVEQTVTRRVTNVGPAATYNVAVVPPTGFTVSVNPSVLTLSPGQSASYTVTFTRTTATLNVYAFGSLTWSDGTRSVRSPLVVRPLPMSAPATLNLTGASGSTNYTIKFGYTGAFAATAHGLVAPVTTNQTVADDPTNNFNTANPAGNQGIQTKSLVIPAGTRLARIALFDEFTDGADDLDLYVYNAAGTLVGASGGGTSAETISLSNPAAGTYTVYVHGWQTDGPDSNYTLFDWTVGADTGNMTVSAPASAVAGATGNVTVNWSGLAAATRYLGVVRYLEGAAERGRTVVNVIVP